MHCQGWQVHNQTSTKDNFLSTNFLSDAKKKKKKKISYSLKKTSIVIQPNDSALEN